MSRVKLSILAMLLFAGTSLYYDIDIGPVRNIRRSLVDSGLMPSVPNAPPASTTNANLSDRRDGTIRIASFNIQVFGEQKISRPDLTSILARVVRSFDVVAIQEIRSERQDILPRFVEMINADGHRYDYVIGPRLGRTVSKEQYAYVFNTATIELDRESLYTVNDPDDLLHREPFVAGFRARIATPEQAFTFTLVDIHTDPDEAQREVNVLDDVFRAVRNDGRYEDDVILLGDLNADERHLGELGQLPYMTWSIAGIPTNTRHTHTYDNCLFDRRATTEFMGRSGVVDLVREFNITQELALEVSDHMPIWAEFSVFEGGQPGRFAGRPEPGSPQ